MSIFAPEPNKTRVLVVDDSTSYRRLLMRHLQAWGGYEILEAADGDEAMAMILEHGIGIVISDWEMPGMSGPDLCLAVRDAGLDHYVYFILVSSRAETDDFMMGMESGADDFLSKPIDQQELRFRLRVARRILDLEAKLEERNRRLASVNRVVEQDLRAAAQMQMALLPRPDTRIDAVECRWIYQPSMYVSGDMHNFFMLDRTRLAFYMIDVAGHGIKPAMVSVTLSRLLAPDSRLVREDQGERTGLPRSPSSVLSELNRTFKMSDDSSTYFTMVYGVLDISNGRGLLARAGHPHPLVVNARQALVQGIEEGGVPIGLMDDPVYQDAAFSLSAGDMLVLYTDGITECENPTGAPYGEDRLLGVIRDSLRHPLDHVVKEIRGRLENWRGQSRQAFDDDVSLLIFRYQPAFVPTADSPRTPEKQREEKHPWNISADDPKAASNA